MKQRRAVTFFITLLCAIILEIKGNPLPNSGQKDKNRSQTGKNCTRNRTAAVSGFENLDASIIGPEEDAAENRAMDFWPWFRNFIARSGYVMYPDTFLQKLQCISFVHCTGPMICRPVRIHEIEYAHESTFLAHLKRYRYINIYSCIKFYDAAEPPPTRCLYYGNSRNKEIIGSYIFKIWEGYGSDTACRQVGEPIRDILLHSDTNSWNTNSWKKNNAEREDLWKQAPVTFIYNRGCGESFLSMFLEAVGISMVGNNPIKTDIKYSDPVNNDYINWYTNAVVGFLEKSFPNRNYGCRFTGANGFGFYASKLPTTTTTTTTTTTRPLTKSQLQCKKVYDVCLENA